MMSSAALRKLSGTAHVRCRLCGISKSSIQGSLLDTVRSRPARSSSHINPKSEVDDLDAAFNASSNCRTLRNRLCSCTYKAFAVLASKVLLFNTLHPSTIPKINTTNRCPAPVVSRQNALPNPSTPGSMFRCRTSWAQNILSHTFRVSREYT